MRVDNGLFPHPGAYRQAQDMGAVSKDSLRCEAQTCIDGDSRGMKRSTYGRVGVGQKKCSPDH